MLTHNHRHHMASSSSSFFNTLTLFLFLLQHSLIIVVAVTETSPPPTPIPEDATTIAQSQSQPQHTVTPFKPSVAIVIGVFTTLFSLTFLLLLYIKHINNSNNTGEIINIDSSSFGGSGGGGDSSFVGGRKNSGIDRSVVESLPIFRFGSLTGQKEGLDCAVCLSKFESSEVLRLLPKCKHAFHVECVDTWLDAHSTCPLCRYRVDPEDILLVMEDSSSSQQVQNKKEDDECVVEIEIEKGKMMRNEIAEYYRKRHSSVGEKESERERERERKKTASFRRSLDSSRKKNENSVGLGLGLGCFVGTGPRKDGMLLTKEETETETERRRRSSVERRRLEHRIIVSPSITNIRSGLHKNQRWSDVQACDLLYLTSEMMIMSESRRGKHWINDSCWNGRGVINERSVSEITGFTRFQTSNTNKQ